MTAGRLDPALLQLADTWQAELFLGQDPVQDSPVNLLSPAVPISAQLSYGLSSMGLQMPPCAEPTACDLYFEVSKEMRGRAHLSSNVRFVTNQKTVVEMSDLQKSAWGL